MISGRILCGMEPNDQPVTDDASEEHIAAAPGPIQPSFPPQVQAKRKRNKRIALIVVVVILVLAAGAAGYMLLHHKSKTPTKQSTTNTQNLPAPAADTNSDLSEYTSPADGLNLSFSYPSNWTASPDSGKSSNAITITSPLVSLPDAATGADVTGKVVVQIRGDTANIKELSSTKATAPQDPVQYAYKAPTAAQHQYFYVSFVQLATPATAQGAFQEVAITGINQIPKGTAITSDLLGEVDPLVTASFNKCTATVCTAAEQTPVGIAGQSWQNNKTMLQVQALFESLKFN
jgi:hypothetical protein